MSGTDSARVECFSVANVPATDVLAVCVLGHLPLLLLYFPWQLLLLLPLVLLFSTLSLMSSACVCLHRIAFVASLYQWRVDVIYFVVNRFAAQTSYNLYFQRTDILILSPQKLRMVWLKLGVYQVRHDINAFIFPCIANSIPFPNQFCLWPSFSSRCIAIASDSSIVSVDISA